MSQLATSREHMLTIVKTRDMLDDFKPSRERSLAATKLDEFEMWLARCEPTEEFISDETTPLPMFERGTNDTLSPS